ncbi:hypothetical protein BV898_15236 [Hypsibius exemplaris]|uniref:Uncharacterized protein n=1 Tax=Hypsibius exemplaris TaxID=2072580 RepID=A0A9X6NC88_HYPEX|nr:hypothetical protein BV898_15236 [Hypsibius exemplaris]
MDHHDGHKHSGGGGGGLEKRSSCCSSPSLARRSSAQDKPIDDEAGALAKRYRTQVEREHGPLQEYVPETYQTSISEGLVYMILIRVAPKKYVKLGVRLPVDKAEPQLLYIQSA